MNKFKDHTKTLALSLIMSLVTTLLMHYKFFPRGSALRPKFHSFSSELEFIATFIFFCTTYILLFRFLNKQYAKKGDWICPSDEIVYTFDIVEENNEHICPKCKSKLVPLKGFYDKD